MPRLGRYGLKHYPAWADEQKQPVKNVHGLDLTPYVDKFFDAYVTHSAYFHYRECIEVIQELLKGRSPQFIAKERGLKMRRDDGNGGNRAKL